MFVYALKKHHCTLLTKFGPDCASTEQLTLLIGIDEVNYCNRRVLSDVPRMNNPRRSKFQSCLPL